MLHKLEKIVKKAGSFIAASKSSGHVNKSNSKDFVTVQDIKAQNILEQELSREFPKLPVVSEEHASELRDQLNQLSFTGFVIDPIDGTYNFKRDMRESAVSIGYVENGEPQVGVIFDPYKNELFTAQQGSGAYRNGIKITVSDQTVLEGASVATSNSYNDAAMARNLTRHLALYEKTGVMPWTSCPGSGVLIMAYVACGRFDIYHHNGLKPWDNAAAFLLMRQAGGRVLTLRGEEAPFTSATVLAGNPALVGRLQDVFTKIDPTLLQ